MRMQMQMQMQWMQMMNGGGPGSANGSAPGAIGQRRDSSFIVSGGAPTLQIPGIGGGAGAPLKSPNPGRAMSLMDVNTAPWRGSMPTYAPSVAPSERSNVGLPGRYRPVSNATDSENAPNGGNSRTASFTGELANRWKENAKPTSNVATSTIAQATRASAMDEPEEDEEAGWAAMKAKRERKKGVWKEQKKENAIKGMLEGFE